MNLLSLSESNLSQNKTEEVLKVRQTFKMFEKTTKSLSTLKTFYSFCFIFHQSSNESNSFVSANPSILVY